MDMASSLLLSAPFSLEIIRMQQLKLLSPSPLAGCFCRGCWRISPATKLKLMVQALPPSEQSVHSELQAERATESSLPSSVSSSSSSSSPSNLTSERGITFSTGSSFFRPQSSLARDLGVLAAALHKRSHGQLRVLDAMSGCGVRALRYLIQSEADFALVNDCNPSLHSTMVENLSHYVPLEGLHSPPLQWMIHVSTQGNSGLQVNTDDLESVGNDDSTLGYGRTESLIGTQVVDRVQEDDIQPSSDGGCNNLPASETSSGVENLGKGEKNSSGREERHLVEPNNHHQSRSTMSLLTQYSLNTYSYGSSCDKQHDSDKEMSSSNVRWHVCHEEATKLLAKCNLNMDFYDFIDIDSFGSESFFLGPALSALRYGGLLFVTCTDGFASGGLRPYSSLAQYGTFMRPMPYANELGLRMLMGAVVKEAALRNMSVSPVFSVYAPHGPVFRVLVRATAGRPQKIMHYGFIYYCGKCGNSKTVDWEKLGSTCCPCSEKAGVWFDQDVWSTLDRTSP